MRPALVSNWMSAPPARRLDPDEERAHPGRTVTAPAPERPGADLRAASRRAAQVAVAVTQVPVSIDSASPCRSATARSAGDWPWKRPRPESHRALGFQFADASGKVLGDGYEAPPKWNKSRRAGRLRDGRASQQPILLRRHDRRTRRARQPAALVRDRAVAAGRNPAERPDVRIGRVRQFAPGVGPSATASSRCG